MWVTSAPAAARSRAARAASLPDNAPARIAPASTRIFGSRRAMSVDPIDPDARRRNVGQHERGLADREAPWLRLNRRPDAVGELHVAAARAGPRDGRRA